MLLKVYLSLILFLIGQSVFAKTNDLQGYLRTGMVNGSFAGADSGDFSIATSLELELEFFYSNKSSIHSRTTISLDPDSGQFKYIHIGAGQKFYLFSKSRGSQGYSEGVFTSIQPRIRYYIGYNLGLAQIQVRSVTSSLSVQSVTLEIGAGGGAIYQLSERFGVNLELMGAKGFAMSSVTVDSTIIRALVGVVGYF